MPTCAAPTSALAVVPGERVAEFFATCLCGSLLPYAIACGSKVQEGVSSLNGTVLLPGPRCKDPYV